MIVDKLLQEELKTQAREINGSERLYLELYQVINILKDYELQKQVSVEPVVKLKLAEYVQMNFDKYWDEMGETGAENYFETATQKELIAYGQFRAFESVQNFLEGNSKFSV